VGLPLFDGTAAQQAQILTDANAGDVLLLGDQDYAVTFNVQETDVTCGPGRYAIVSITLAASVASVTPASLAVSLRAVDLVTGEPSRPLALSIARVAVGSLPT